MEANKASGTAIAIALMRAVHTRCDQPTLVADPYAERLITDAERAAWLERLLLMLPAAVQHGINDEPDRTRALERVVHANPAYGTILARARYAEDQLAAALVDGVRQYVLVGAGFDTFAFRAPELAAQLRIIEIDHPATQALKHARLASAGLLPPANLSFVASDLEHESVADALARSSYRRTDPAFFTCLGVTQFLTRSANLGLLAGIVAAAVPRSQLVFDYLELAAFAPHQAADEIQRIRAERATTDEPWQSGFDPVRLQSDLQSIGFTLVEDLDPAELERRYCAVRTDGLHTIAHAHVARARVLE